MKAFLTLALLTIMLGLLAGCVGIQSDPNSDLPNNAPAGWEGKTLGLPVG